MYSKIKLSIFRGNFSQTDSVNNAGIYLRKIGTSMSFYNYINNKYFFQNLGNFFNLLNNHLIENGFKI